jgi:Ca2+-dependent lipid-binding protein
LELEARHNGTSNPYCKINVLGEWMHSKTISHDLDPRWEEEFEFLLDEAPIDGVLLLEVWTRFTYWGKESLGIAKIPLGDVVRNRRILDIYPLDGETPRLLLALSFLSQTCRTSGIGVLGVEGDMRNPTRTH